MTTSPLTRPGGGPATTMAAGPLPTRQRRPGYAALAIALIAALAALGAWLYSQAGQKTPVVVVVAPVPAGHVIERADLSTVAVAGAVTAVAGTNLDSLVGQTAAVDLLPNMLVQRSMVSAQGPLRTGIAAVGVAVSGGQIPADGVRSGDIVTVLQVPPAEAGSGDVADAKVLVPRATVFSSRADPAQAGGTLVTVLVPSSDLAAVAAAGAAGRAALVLVADQ